MDVVTTFWDSSQPGYPITAECVQISKQFDQSYEWENEECSDKQPVLCEMGEFGLISIPRFLWGCKIKVCKVGP